MLTFDKVTVSRNGRPLFLPISASLLPGEILTVSGASGLGKSTFLHALIQPSSDVELSGTVYFDGNIMDPIHRLSSYSQTVFQDPLLFPHLSVGSNIALSINQLCSSERKKRINDLLSDMELSGLANHDPFQLSRGQMMRVSVARALAPYPQILLLDEPFSALDQRTRDRIRDRLWDQIRLHRSYGVLVTHQPEDQPSEGPCICLTPFSLDH